MILRELSELKRGSGALLRSAVAGWFPWLMLAVLWSVAPTGRASTVDGSLSMRVITAYNFVVDSNVQTPADVSPRAAHLAVKICNTGTTPLTDVLINIGTLTDPSTSAGTPGTFPSRTVSQGGYSGTFALQMPGGAADASRAVVSLAPGECVVQYFFVTYPLTDASNHPVWGVTNDPNDDLWLNYDIWASAKESATTRRVNQTTKVTMRNEISAMANKVQPQTTSKVPDLYLNAIQEALGWRPSPGNPRIPGALAAEGIWYDLGNIGEGFDNNGDGLYDHNAWMQPVGDPAKFNPLCVRLVKSYGLIILKFGGGAIQLIPFEDQLYFENLPLNAVSAVGLVYYEFLPLGGGCSSTLVPYQEVASGTDNEKFNGDYAGGGVSTLTTPTPQVAFNKTGPATVAAGGTVTYVMTSQNTGTVGIGNPALGLPFVVEDGIPSQLVYLAGSAAAANTVPAGRTLTISWSSDNGTTWTTTEPSAASVTRIRWALYGGALAPGTTLTVGFQATVPGNYSSTFIDNTGIIRIGTTGTLATSTVRTLLSGNNSLGDQVWRDDNYNSVKDGVEPGISAITVTLYYDTNGNGVRDAGDILYGTTQTDASGVYGFSNLPDGKWLVTVDYLDPQLPAGYTLPNSASATIAVNLDATHATSAPVNVLTADWPFISALSVAKTVSPSTYGDGDLINYAITLENRAAAVPSNTIPVQTSWAVTVSAGRTAQLPANAQGAPNNTFARVDYAQNADTLTTSGGLTFADQSGTITKVELVIQSYLNQALTDDTLQIYLNGTANINLFTTLSTATLNGMVGPAKELVVNLTSFNPGGWSWAQALALTTQLRSAKNFANDGATFWVDAIGIRVTATVAPPATGTYGPSTIDPLPLTDTYDATKLAFVSASVPPTSTTSGTINWANLGPLNAGTRQTLTVTFRALTPPDITVPPDGQPDPTTTPNTASATGAFFVSGLPANPGTSTVPVTINPRGKIGDFVWLDLNSNGVQDSGEPGIPNVRVTLDNGAKVRTDANGGYLFTGLVDGTYTVTVDTSTLPFSTFTQTKDPDLANGVTTGDSASTVTLNNSDLLANNNSFLDRDFGYKSTQNAISGKIFQDNNGNGLQDPGENYLTGVTVTLSGSASATTTTDSLGFYSFGALANGTYTVTVTQPASTTQTLDPDVTINNATTVVASGGNLYPNRNFAYRPSGALTIGDTVYMDWNGDGTQGAGEGGIANVDVFLYEDSNGDGLIDPVNDALIGTSVTSATGIYGFSGLPAANYIVVVNTADPDFPSGVQPVQDFDGVRDSKAIINLTASLNTVDFGYKPVGTGTIGDLVYGDANGDGLPQAGESGLPNVTVTLYADTNNDGILQIGTDAVVATTTTGAAGGYLFSGLRAGKYLVLVSASDANIPTDAYGAKFRATTADPQAVTLGAGQNYLLADFGFAAASTIGQYVFFDANSNGTQDQFELGIPNVTVQLFADANADGVADSGTPLTSAVTDAAGFYRFSNLGAGTYFVKVVTSTLPQAGGQPIPQTADPDRDGVPVGNNSFPGLPPGDNADAFVTLPLGANYTGANFGYLPPVVLGDFVWLDLNHDGVQDPGERGLGGVTVKITNGTTTFTTTTEADGRWSIANVPDGSWTVSVPSSNFAVGAPLQGLVASYDAQGAVDSAAAFVLSGGNINLGVGKLGLDFGYSLNGNLAVSGTIVIGDTGVLGTADVPASEIPVAGVTVYLSTQTGGLLGSVPANAAGYYSFTGLPAGGYRVTIGTTAAPLVGETLNTTPANNAAVTAVSTSASAASQTFSLTTSSLTRVDYAYTSLVQRDYGDLPLVFGMTTLAQDGARHIIPTGGATVYLGTPPDAENDGQATAAADGDNTNGTNDETGVTPVTPLSWSNGTVASGHGGSAQIAVTGSGWLVGWVDWNGDADFLDSGEMIINQAVTTGTSTFSFDIPAGTIVAGNQSWFARFRVFTSQPPFPAFAYSGEVTDGEVEDYWIQKSPPPTPLATIGDYVWLDENSNGLQDAGESGIGNVRMELYASNGATLLGTTYTDANGGYLFRNVPAGTYVVKVATTGNGALAAGLAANRTFDFDGTGTAHAATVTVAAGQEFVAADFGYNWSTTSNVSNNTGTGAIGDRIWVDADGDGVQDPGESGLGGVPVSLINLGADGIRGTGDDTTTGTTTAADGSYIFVGLSPGAYVVMVNGGTPPAGYTLTGDPDTTPDNQTTTPILLAPGDVYVNADFGYQPTGNFASIGDLVYFDANANGVFDGSDYGIAGVTVALIRDTNGNGVYDAGDVVIAATTSDAAGAYLFPRVSTIDGTGTDDYLVWVTDTANVLGGTTATGDADGTNPATGIVTGLGISSVLDLAGNNLTQDFGYMAPGQTPTTGLIGDTIYLDQNGNGLQGAGESGIEGVTVQLFNAAGTLLQAATTTDENGHYSFPALPAGTYTVKVLTGTLPGGGVGLVNTDDPDIGGNPDTGDSQSVVTLAAGQINLAQDFGYHAAVPNTISGTIWNDPNGDGLLTEAGRYAGVTVVLLDGNGNVVATTTTDGSGNYTFTGLPDGTYQVDVTDAANVLNGLWHSVGPAPGTDNNSQSDPYTVTVGGGVSNSTGDFGYYGTPAALGDRVWNDNGAGGGVANNGIQDGTEPGIPGVPVRLTITWPNGGGTTVVQTVTDASGNYQFGNLLLDENLTGATYSISVPTLPGPASPIHAQGGETPVDAGNPAGEAATPLRGQVATTYDFGFVNPFSLGNRVWADTNGDGLLNNSETGIANVTVQIFAADAGGNPNGPVLLTTTTASGGYYRFNNLPAGDYVLYLPAGNFATGQPLFGLYSSGTSTGTFNGIDPDVDPTDSDDNGFNAINPAATGVRSAAVTLTLGGEPGGSDLGPGDVNDSNSNLTVDFGFASPPPTAVTLAYVKGWALGGKVTVEWETVTEQNTAGFDLYRLTPGGGKVRVNGSLIAALNREAGGVYRVLDENLPVPSHQTYELVETETSGKVNTYGPFAVEVRAAAVGQGVRVADGRVRVSFQGAADAEYEIEVTEDLLAGRWISAGVVRAGSTGELVYEESRGGTMRFYRALPH